MDFARLLAHELKGPLLSIELRLKSSAADSPAVRDCLAELQRLNELVDRVLAWNDLQSLRSESFELARVIERLEQRFRSIVETRGSVLLVENNEAEVRGDADATEIVLSNLLDNALRHGGPGARIELRSTIHGGTVEVIVEDSGTGIPEEARDLVFEPFYRADRGSGGSGLGLFIARQLAEASGGSLRLDGPARFVLTLPASR